MIDDQELDKALRIMTIIWVAMIVSVLIYLFILPRHLGGVVHASLPPETFNILRTVLYILSIGIVLAARYLVKHLLSGRVSLSQQTTIASHPAVQRYATAMIIALALSEAVAIFGLVLFILAGDTRSLYLLGLISILSMLMHRPTRREIVDAASNMDAFSRGPGARL